MALIFKTFNSQFYKSNLYSYTKVRIIIHAEMLAIKYLFWQFKNGIPFLIYFIKSNMILIKTMGKYFKMKCFFSF